LYHLLRLIDPLLPALILGDILPFVSWVKDQSSDVDRSLFSQLIIFIKLTLARVKHLTKLWMVLKLLLPLLKFAENEVYCR